MFENNSVYVPYQFIHRALMIINTASVIALVFMRYDAAFKWVILLPVAYFLSMCFFLRGFMLRGVGAIALVGMYGFRMCLLPILCAYGNFYIEPDQSIYLQYFRSAILLMCFECIIVFAALSYYSRKYQNKIIKSEMRESTENDTVILVFAMVSVLIYAMICFSHPEFLQNHYYFLISSNEDAVQSEMANVELQSYGAMYYLAVILELTAKPIAAFALVNWALKKNRKWSIPFSCLIGIFNILWINDRRILSLLLGLCCMLQVLLHMRGRFSKRALYWLVAALGILTVVYCFWGEDTPARIARKFQRYFSGPALMAIGIAVYHNYIQSPVDFFKLLYNDSLLLTGLFESIEMRDYPRELCGEAGYSIWTPMFIGAIQYFHIFAPILIVLVVKYLVYSDYRSMVSHSDLRKMMLNYLTIAISVYMVMYSLELVYYNIIFIGGFYYLLLKLDEHISLFVRK